ncbi:MAG: hypothetical protein QM831_17175 [Kofleriaceae bacterium]
MKSISLNELENVTGGTNAVTPPTTHFSGAGTSSGGLSNDQLLTSLNSIGSSIKGLSQNNNNSLFGGSNGSALMLGMALAMRNRQQSTSVYVGRHGYAWSSSWG